MRENKAHGAIYNMKMLFETWRRYNLLKEEPNPNLSDAPDLGMIELDMEPTLELPSGDQHPEKKSEEPKKKIKITISHGGAEGYYSSSGRLENGVNMAGHRPDLFIYPDTHSKKRQWAHPVLIDSITAAASVALEGKESRILVRDISRQMGGHFSGHKSHRNGLDIDIGFIWKDSAPSRVRESSSFASARGNSALLDIEANVKFVKKLQSDPKVKMIIVHSKIILILKRKKISSRKLKSSKKLDRTHHDHYHIRYHNPSYSK